MSVCAPGKELNKVTCFSNKSLKVIINKYNTRYPDDKILFNKKKFDRKKAWTDIKQRLFRWTPKCTEDYCLLEHPIVSKIPDLEISEQTFRPEMPESWNSNPNEWLSTLDIADVLNQYEDKYTDFRFIGPVPIDFDHKIASVMCVSDELCKINIKKLYKGGMRKLGVVFNLDPHYKNGSHWVTMFLDINSGGAYFFDSAGSAPPIQVKELMKRIKHQGNALILDKTIKLNQINDLHKCSYTFTTLKNKNKIKVGGKEDSSKLLKNIIHFIKNGVVISLNEVTHVNGNILTLRFPLECDDCDNFISKCFKNFYNTNQLQFKDTECGIFAINFIEEMLKGRRYDELLADPYKNDEFMTKLRTTYWRPNKKLT